MKSKYVAAALALVLGFVGGHKFYLGRPVLGILYLFFCWTFIPFFVSFLEMIVLLTMSEHEFNIRYNPHLFFPGGQQGFIPHHGQNTVNQAQNVTINLGQELEKKIKQKVEAAQKRPPMLEQQMDIYTELEILDDLRQRGILSDEEFEQRKQIILKR